MQVGDKKQAGILGAVAVGAVAFVIFQLVPKAEARPAPKANGTPAEATSPAASPTGASGTAPSAPPSAPTAGASGLTRLERDPFAFGELPKLRRSTPTRPRSEERSADAERNSPREESGSLLPASAIMPQVVPEPVVVRAAAPPTPKPISKPAAEPKVPKPAAPRLTVPVRLLGVVASPEAVAMLLIGQRERTARVGDEVAPGVRIASISLDGITFRAIPGRVLARTDLAPGEDTNL